MKMLILFILLVVLIVLVGVGSALSAIGMGLLVLLGVIVAALVLWLGGAALADLVILLHKKLIARRKRLEDADKEDDD
jgi:hypothetical protein